MNRRSLVWPSIQDRVAGLDGVPAKGEDAAGHSGDGTAGVDDCFEGGDCAQSRHVDHCPKNRFRTFGHGPRRSLRTRTPRRPPIPKTTGSPRTGARTTDFPSMPSTFSKSRSFVDGCGVAYDHVVLIQGNPLPGPFREIERANHEVMVFRRRVGIDRESNTCPGRGGREGSRDERLRDQPSYPFNRLRTAPSSRALRHLTRAEYSCRRLASRQEGDLVLVHSAHSSWTRLLMPRPVLGVSIAS